MQLFYTKDIRDNVAILSEDEARHVKVLRKNTGDILTIIDGTGYAYEARIKSFSDSKKSSEVTLEILAKELWPRTREYFLHLFIAPTKQNERMEWMLEKAIEVGLDEITFLQTEHSEKSRINKVRLEKIAISAMKQSGEYHMPKINELLTFETVLKAEKEGISLLAHCNDNFSRNSLKGVFANKVPKGNINIFIGPEGDFSLKEIEQAYQNGFRGLSLGNTRLRTETAGLYATIAMSNL